MENSLNTMKTEDDAVDDGNPLELMSRVSMRIPDSDVDTPAHHKPTNKTSNKIQISQSTANEEQNDSCLGCRKHVWALGSTILMIVMLIAYLIFRLVYEYS